MIVVALAACGSDDRPVDIPAVEPGAFEAGCQTLCTLPSGDEGCSAKHAEYCLASCRVRTNGMTAACGQCLLAAGEAIHGFVDAFGDVSCETGGAASLDACRDECDDSGATPPAPSLATLCELECKFYMEEPTALACSADGYEPCMTECAATIQNQGRLCAQCVIEGVVPTKTCFNSECDCSPFFNDNPAIACGTLCDDRPPPT